MDQGQPLDDFYIDNFLMNSCYPYEPEIPTWNMHLPSSPSSMETTYFNTDKYPRSINADPPHEKIFQEQGTCEAFPAFQNTESATCNGGNFWNYMLQPTPYLVDNFTHLAMPESLNNLSRAIEEKRLQDEVEFSGVTKKAKVARRKWTAVEDVILRKFVEQLGEKNWRKIAELMGGKTGKQCRDRWNNHAKPNIKKGKLSADEELRLIKAHKEIGPQWTEIAKLIPGRAENTIKNHWYKTKRQMFSHSRKRQNSAQNEKSMTPLQDYIRSLAENYTMVPAATIASTFVQPMINSDNLIFENFFYSVDALHNSELLPVETNEELRDDRNYISNPATNQIIQSNQLLSYDTYGIQSKSRLGNDSDDNLVPLTKGICTVDRWPLVNQSDFISESNLLSSGDIHKLLHEETISDCRGDNNCITNHDENQTIPNYQVHRFDIYGIQGNNNIVDQPLLQQDDCFLSPTVTLATYTEHREPVIMQNDSIFVNTFFPSGEVQNMPKLWNDQTFLHTDWNNSPWDSFDKII